VSVGAGEASATGSGPGVATSTSGSGASSGEVSSGTGAGGAGSDGGGGAAELPAEGATTECQILASVGAWYDQPQGNACTSCIRQVSGQDDVAFTPCSTVGNACYLDPQCHQIWICLSESQYAISGLEACVDAASDPSRALFLELLACILPWCGEPDECAYSGPTPGCDLP